MHTFKPLRIVSFVSPTEDFVDFGRVAGEAPCVRPGDWGREAEADADPRADVGRGAEPVAPRGRPLTVEPPDPRAEVGRALDMTRAPVGEVTDSAAFRRNLSVSHKTSRFD